MNNGASCGWYPPDMESHWDYSVQVVDHGHTAKLFLYPCHQHFYRISRGSRKFLGGHLHLKYVLLFNNSCADAPFKSWRALETLIVGGITTTIWIWSDITLSSVISMLCRFATSCKTSSQSFLLLSPLSILYLYLGHHSRWYIFWPMLWLPLTRFIKNAPRQVFLHPPLADAPV